MQQPVSHQIVVIDLHRRRSVIVRTNAESQVLGIDQVLKRPRRTFAGGGQGRTGSRGRFGGDERPVLGG
jgi:hypothetical protein